MGIGFVLHFDIFDNFDNFFARSGCWTAVFF